MADAETCACGTFAIGACQQCGAPICMHHSRLLAGATLCLRHHGEALNRAEPARPSPAPPPDGGPLEPPDRRGRRGWGRRR